MPHKYTPRVTKTPPELDSVYNNQQFSKPADGLIAAIQSHNERVNGKTLNHKEVVEIATQILESRS